MDRKPSEMYTPVAEVMPAGAAAGLIREAEVEDCFCNEGPEASEDELLVQGCLRGHHEAWEELIDKYKRLIYSIPMRYGASSADAADVFQAVCIEVLHSLPQLKSAQSLRSWLITV